MSETVWIRAEGVSKRFNRHVRPSVWSTFQDISQQLTGTPVQKELRDGEFWALHDVSFQIKRGESVAIVGDNGAGKSTLIKLLMRRMLPTAGVVETRGSISALTVLGLGFDPVLSGRENILLNAATLGLTRAQTLKVLDQIIDFAELREFIDAPIQTYSSGMKSRLGYAVAAHVQPDVLLLDEVLAVGDISFRRKCRRHIKNFIDQGGTTLLVTHDLHAVQTICTRCIVLEKGRLVFDGPPTEGVRFYLASQAEDDDADPHGNESAPAGDEVSANGSELSEPSPPVEIPAEPAAKPAEEVFEDAPLVEPAINYAAPAVESREETPSADGPMESNLPHAEDRAPEPRSRSSRSPMVIQAVGVRSRDGKHLMTNHPAEFYLRYHSTESIDRVVWGFTVTTEDGVTNIGSYIFGFREPWYSISPGQHGLKVRIDKLPLMSGTYGLKAGVGELETGAAIAERGWEDALVLFTVRAEPTAENNIRSYMNDLILLEGTPIVE